MCSLGGCHKKGEKVKRLDVLVVSQEVETQSQEGDAVRGTEATRRCEWQNEEEEKKEKVGPGEARKQWRK